MRKITLSLLLAAGLIQAAAAPVDAAKQLYNEGRYSEALEALEPLVTKSPKDGTVNYWYGATLLALGRNEAALAPLQVAEGRGVAEAARLLAVASTDLYRPDDARRWYEKYATLIRKAKKSVPDEVEQAQSRLVLMENMLERVEKIAVIDSIVVDADRFFANYTLSPETGRIVDGATVRMPDVEMAFVTENNTQILYSAPDSTDTFVLMSADILDDGTTDTPRPLEGDDLGGGGNAEYPFLLSDGLTLYYANDGEGSLGGYDIFLTRRNDDGFLQPQNIGMPYNSPYDDYMLAIDETTGAGWWATDRNRIPGKLTIYVFIPSDTRINVTEDDPNISSLARLDNIALTREPGRDYRDVLARIQQQSMATSTKNASITAGGDFALPIGSATRIYTALDDFQSGTARAAMIQAIDARAEIERISQRLALLRQEYANGHHNESINILNLEHGLDDARERQQTFINRAIAEELKVVR